MGEINDNVYRLLQASIAKETNKAKMKSDDTLKSLQDKCAQMARKIVEMEAERRKLRAVVTVSATYLEVPLQSVENVLKTDPTLLDYESLADYSKLARFMFAAHGRKHMAEVAEKRMRELSA